MARAASLKIFFCSQGDNPPRNRKTNNAGKKWGIDPPHPLGVGPVGAYVNRSIQEQRLEKYCHEKYCHKLGK
jgi:hypothetical protein